MDRSVCNFKTRDERSTTKGDEWRRLSRTMWREWKKITEVSSVLTDLYMIYIYIYICIYIYMYRALYIDIYIYIQSFLHTFNLRISHYLIVFNYFNVERMRVCFWIQPLWLLYSNKSVDWLIDWLIDWTLYLTISFILSQGREFRNELMWWNLGNLMTARAAEVRLSWRRLNRRDLKYSI